MSTPVQRGREPVRVTLPADLAVGDDVQAGILLGADSQQRGVPLRLLKELGRDAPQFARPYPRRKAVSQPAAVNQPIGLWIASNK